MSITFSYMSPMKTLPVNGFESQRRRIDGRLEDVDPMVLQRLKTTSGKIPNTFLEEEIRRRPGVDDMFKMSFPLLVIEALLTLDTSLAVSIN